MAGNRKVSELKRSADRINTLLRDFTNQAKQLTSIVSTLNKVASDIDVELSEIIKVVDDLDNSGDSSTSLRKLKAKNGLNLKISAGVNTHLGRLKDMNNNTLEVS